MIDRKMVDSPHFDRKAPEPEGGRPTAAGQILLLGVFLFFLLVSGPQSSMAASDSKSDTPGTFDHTLWTETLEQFVDQNGFVNYQALAKDRQGLTQYLELIGTTGPSTHPELFPDENHQLAYYLNAYNALVFEGVLARGPEKVSVWKGGLISGYGFFVRQKFTVDQTRTGLKKLEDDIVRKRFADPRIHAALNCASIGCPRLPRQAFSGDTLDQELDREMRFFVSEERNVRIDHADRQIYLSEIFDWFEADFLAFERRQGEAKPSVIDYVNRFREDGKSLPTDYKVGFTPYDKSINAQ